ncbi:hypothetical protein F7R91_01075 [Streptomyces luteolifulvus]|uniref:Uncharacterized protein n=1 Tax=Streptomyces luteolifulvus TaxID=2615112 RepID=A0A6H9V8Z5_9ACTN|nr:hypothetical protein [Streptomyces luteolifulvus]KAB1150618.1 hypothetical protein F7R91_01075 [Streptomyces luteolifulvus]
MLLGLLGGAGGTGADAPVDAAHRRTQPARPGHGLSGHPDPADVLGRSGALPGPAVAAVWLSIHTFRSYQRAV